MFEGSFSRFAVFFFKFCYSDYEVFLLSFY